jgi:hypothetical protein
MRIVTRPDFDGIVCAVLLYDALPVRKPVKWVGPNDIQKGLVDILPGDIIANLPYSAPCFLWFDHHYSNQIDTPFNGAFRTAPSAARVVYDYYRDELGRDYSGLIIETDKIDAADLSLDEVVQPENYPYVLLSMTILPHKKQDEPYWNHLVDLLRTEEISVILTDPEVARRCQAVVEENQTYKSLLEKNTTMFGHVSVTDFRSFDLEPVGNRFLVYSLFPDAVVSVKIRHDDNDREMIRISVGHSIFNRNCKVNVGVMLLEFDGGGHPGAGACRIHISGAESVLKEIVRILADNKENESLQ